MTLLVGKWSPYKSNSVLNSVYREEFSPLKQLYDEGVIEKGGKEIIEKFRIKIEEENEF